MASSLESLPNELLDQIISHLATDPPSWIRCRQEPDASITKSVNKSLKHLSVVSRGFTNLIRPWLFAHACLDFADEPAFSTFMVKSGLCQNVKSLVICVLDDADVQLRVNQGWCKRIFGYLDPIRITVVAPPRTIGRMLNTRIDERHSWAFDIGLQSLQLECAGPRAASHWQLPAISPGAGLLEMRPWTSFCFHEGSSLKAYNHYEYFLSNVPSLLGNWGRALKEENKVEIPSALETIRSFSYTAIFPFYNHVDLVLTVISAMTRLETLSIQLSPDKNNHATELEQRGSMDPHDPWMELETSYTLIGFSIAMLASLREFRSLDFHIPAIQPEIIRAMEEHLGSDWSRHNSGKISGSDKQAPFGPPSSSSSPHPSTLALPSHIKKVLAHNLLRPVSRASEPTSLLDEEGSTNGWNLREDLDIGFQDPTRGIFRSGAVIGFSRLKTRSKDSDEYIGQIPRYLLTTHLLNTCTSTSSEPSTFIIHPNSFEAFAPRTLLNALQNAPGHPGLSRTEAMKCLDTVQLLPVHNFPNAAQAIGRVSESLQAIQERRQGSPGAENPHQPVVMIVVGLDTLAEGVVRTSNPVRGTAFLAATLRNLTHMSRAYTPWLSILLLNTNGLGPAFVESAPQHLGSNQARSSNEENTRSSPDDGIHSIFQMPGSSLLSNLLMRTLDQGIDTHILLSDVKAALVVEVIKDRVGAGLGKWGIWSPRR
ncbi:hypothetical protein N7462_009815 [Penicillium macrosclerotiorum]|uniref:uncharacterized protein n=1 Tax=Penicillium macrosclerotiorum TaxID=303699 RepID=UPI0025475211|nr:uncharacterized protein N7462_009815 [Penicillium macrosclerotiorum]KAJ5668745.1 hypothetical protein N7462_009815 [Penicillium macrosclerotiorum]